MDITIARRDALRGVEKRGMRIQEWLEEDDLTLRQLADGLGVAGIRSVQRYRDGERIPDRERMRRLVEFSEGRVTPNDIYGLQELIDELREKRAQRTGAASETSAAREAA